MALRNIGQRLGSSPMGRLTPQAKQAASHYQTPGHRAWARAVIQRAGGSCQQCGRSHGDDGQRLRLYADHIQELRDGGAPLDLDNGQALCPTCHGAKTVRHRAARHGLR